MIVADTNLIAYFSIHTECSALAEAVCAVDSIWAAPLLWRSEYRATLMKYINHAGMNFETAIGSLRVAEEAIAGREYAVDARKVLELAMQSKCSAYDCEYIALARDLGVPLVTADKQILRAFPKIAVSLEKFAKKK
ncbi:MAG TPA: type II toxin-antitoxin system VapC family toxin [Verrucomicrobiae bacterium]